MDQLTVLSLIACLAVGTLFSALHAGLNDLSRAALEAIADRRRARPAKRARIAAINADVAGHARAVALVRIVCNLAMGVIAVTLVAQARGGAAIGWLDGFIAVVATALLVWFCNIVLADSLARHVGEKLVYAFSSVVRLVYLLQRPFAPFSHAIDSIVRAAAGVKKLNKGEELEQDLRDVFEEGEREGQIDEREREMIEAVVNFKARTVEQIMTPRNEIEALQLTSNLGAITAFVRKARHSRIPVYNDSLDDIVGFFYVKDLLQWLAGGAPRSATGGGAGFDLKSLLRPAMLVPETKTIRALAEEFVEKKVHVAVVADEYGGTAGIVSLEDIIEEVFGDIQDEYEQDADDPPRIDVRPDEGGLGGVADIDARAYIGDVNAALEPLGVEVPESDEYDTLGGFVLSTLGRMPTQNESFTYGGDANGGNGSSGSSSDSSSSAAGHHRRRMVVTVLEATPMKVVRVRILVQAEHKPEIVTEPRVSEAERV